MVLDKDQTEMAVGIIDMEIGRVTDQIKKFRAQVETPRTTWEEKTIACWEGYAAELRELRAAVLS